MQIRPRTIAIVGAPLAAWALFGCLTLSGMAPDYAGAIAFAWAFFWILIARIASGRGGVPGSMRRGAIVASLFCPLPVYLLSLAADGLAVLPSQVGLPMFATLFGTAPLLLWLLSLRPRRKGRNSGPLMVMQWHEYDPHAPAGSIPPRKVG